MRAIGNALESDLTLTVHLVQVFHCSRAIFACLHDDPAVVELLIKVCVCVVGSWRGVLAVST